MKDIFNFNNERDYIILTNSYQTKLQFFKIIISYYKHLII